MTKAAQLMVVATPLGNLDDISARALAVLRNADWVAAEDTRHTQHLLSQYGIRARLLSMHEYNEQARVDHVLACLLKGESVALVSDAGTPLISDPGYRLVKAVQAAGYAVTPIPGPCAAIAALSVAGLPSDHFVFEGFLPPKGEKRTKRIEVLKNETRTLIFYEAVHRIIDLLTRLIDCFGAQRPATLAREMTKKFETIRLSTLGQCLADLQAQPETVRGEFVLVVAGAPPKEACLDAEAERIVLLLLKELPLKQSVKLAQDITGARHQDLYRFALASKPN